MKKLTFCAMAAAVVLAGNVTAEEASLNPWTDCGIGAMVFENNTAAAISNIIWDLGTTAVSSNISSEDSCQGKSIEAAIFIQDNFKSVVEETSQGSGEHLSAMLEILEVDSAAHSETMEAIRSEIAADATSKTATPEAYYSAVMASI